MGITWKAIRWNTSHYFLRTRSCSTANMSVSKRTESDDDDGVLLAAKPQFLKKSKRQKLAKQKEEKDRMEEMSRKQKQMEILQQKKAKKLQMLAENNPERSRDSIDDNLYGIAETLVKKTVRKDKKQLGKQKKFSFEWNNDEDTSSGYQPLVTSTTLQDKLVPRTLSGRLNWDDKHWSEKKLSEMTSRDWRIFKEDFEINSKGALLENPLRSWKESIIPTEILQILRELKYKEPTPIQRAAIPVALKNKDVLGIAETGSGKTLSFVIPLLSYLFKLPRLNNTTKNDGPYALILVPTRELAQQIYNEVLKFTRLLNFRVAAVYGGHQLETNSFDLQDGIEILIATPGRLLDCLDRKILVLNQCFYLVMDEADRMIDLGFENQVSRILSILPNLKKQNYNQFAKRAGIRRNTTMMFTATMPPAIEKLTRNYLDNPSTVIIGNPEKAADTVEQRVEFANTEEIKNKKLLHLLKQKQFLPPIIVFVNYKKTSDALHQLIDSNTNYKSVIIHGSKSQDQREYAIRSLRNGKFDVLIATDLAGRGIDIPNVSLVINYQMSKNIEDYIHRIGRTGRAGNIGTAVTLLNSEEDKDVLYDLKQMIMKSELSKCPDELKRHPAALVKPNQFRSIND